MAEKREVKFGHTIITDWPGQGHQEFSISCIRPDEDGIMCAVFGKDGVVGAEAIEDLERVTDSETGEFVAWLAIGKE